MLGFGNWIAFLCFTQWQRQNRDSWNASFGGHNLNFCLAKIKNRAEIKGRVMFGCSEESCWTSQALKNCVLMASTEGSWNPYSYIYLLSWEENLECSGRLGGSQGPTKDYIQEGNIMKEISTIFYPLFLLPRNIRPSYTGTFPGSISCNNPNCSSVGVCKNPSPHLAKWKVPSERAHLHVLKMEMQEQCKIY